MNRMDRNYLKPYKNLLLVGAFLIVSSQFTNCDSSANNALFQELASACTPDASGYNPCTDQDPTLVQLVLLNNLTIGVVGGNQAWANWFDVGGECNEGGFIPGIGQSSNQILYTLKDENNNTISTSSSLTPPSSCVEGRFIASVQTNGDIQCNCSINDSPPNYPCDNKYHTIVNYTSVVDYTLQLQLLVTDIHGNQIPPNGVSDTQTMTLECQQQCCQ